MSRISTITDFEFPEDDLNEVSTTSRMIDVVYYPSLIDYWRESDAIAINHSRVDHFQFKGKNLTADSVYVELNLLLGGDNEVKTIN